MRACVADNNVSAGPFRSNFALRFSLRKEVLRKISVMFRKKKSSPAISPDRVRAVVGEGDTLSYHPRKERAATWADCEISWDGGSEHGILMDVSETGARVRFAHRGILPRHVRIAVPRLGLKRPVEVVRVDGSDVGLRFLDDSD